ncbi:MAG: hypothetical protein AB1801_18430, partial [Chloroflexota bacterium]
MNTQATIIELLKRIGGMLIAVALIGVGSAVFLTSLARADSPIYGRPGGDDSACIGIVNVDYRPGVAPLCAVKTLPRALSLAGSANTIIFDTGSQILTLPPTASSAGAGDISATAAVTLEVGKTDFPDPVTAGNPLTYTVRITNTGDMNATGVLLIDSLPQVGVVSVKSITTTHGTCDPPDIYNSISCPLGTLVVSDSAIVTIVVTPTAAGNISNIAVVRDAGFAVDLDTASTRVEGVTNLAVSKTDNPDPVYQGRPLTYTITITNGGPTAAADVALTDYLPAGTTFGSATPSQGSCGSGGIVTCTLGLMANNATATITLVVTPTAFGLITNTATITGGDIDPVLSNNTFTETTTVLPAADIGVNKSDNPDPVAAGAVLTYTFIVSNAGPAAATNVALVDSLPGAVGLTGTFTSSQGVCNISLGVFGCNLGDLAVSSTVTVTLRVTVTSVASGTIANTVAVTTTTADLNTANNTDTEITTIGGPATVFLPIILKDYMGPWASLQWVGQTEDRVREVDGGEVGANPFVADGRADGAFRATVNVGSQGSKTVTSVQLASSQGGAAAWDTLIGAGWVLGIFDGGLRLNNDDGTLNQLVTGQVIVTLYASDNAAGNRFPPDTYDYTMTVNFSDGSSVTAQARIPAPPSPPPPPPPTSCQPLATITVGNTPR